MSADYFPRETHFKNVAEITSHLLQNPTSKIIWVIEKSSNGFNESELIGQVAVKIENFLYNNRNTGGSENQIFRHIDPESVHDVFTGENAEDINIHNDIFCLIPNRISASFTLEQNLRNYIFEIFKKEKPDSLDYHVVALTYIIENWENFNGNTVEIIEPNIEALKKALNEILSSAKALRDDLHRQSNQFEENSPEHKFKNALEGLIVLLEDFLIKIKGTNVTNQNLVEISQPYIVNIRKFLSATQEICNEADSLRDSPTGAFVMTSLGTGLLVVMGAAPTGALLTSAGVFASKHLPKKMKFWEGNQ